jgi:hypothetical protein
MTQPDQRATLDGHRGIPDISYNADDFNSAILVYTSFLARSAEPSPWVTPSAPLV